MPPEIKAGDAAFDRHIQKLSESLQARFRYHSIELPDGRVLEGQQSIEHLRWRLGLFDLPQDLRGRRVLDIGAWDGWFSFECERRGAQVVAVDCVELDTFLEAKQLLGSKVEYVTLDVNELSARRLGHFDIVLFFGVLYHLRNPLLGLEKTLELSKDAVLIESFVIQAEDRAVPAVMEFYERAELGGQIDNWCGPSPECLLAMCRASGFAQVELRDLTNQRASVECRRRWPAPSRISGVRPHLHAAVNNRTWAATFHPLKDEYICCYFKYPGAALLPGDVQIEVDGFGVPSLSISANGADAWQVNSVRPGGLEHGRHQVRVRVRQSELSNAVEFTLLDESGTEISPPLRDVPEDAPEVCSVEFRPGGDLRIAAGRAGSLVCYFRTSAELIGSSDIEIEVGEKILRPDSVSSLGANVWQTNILLREALADRVAAVRVRVGGSPWSQVYRY